MPDGPRDNQRPGQGPGPGQQRDFRPNPGGNYWDHSAHRSKVMSLAFKDSFYYPVAEGGKPILKREVFVESPQKLLEHLYEKEFTVTLIRSFFLELKDVAKRIRQLSPGETNTEYFKFLRMCEYQVKRGILDRNFCEFVKAHEPIVTRNADEFLGFVEFLTSIVANMKSKN